MFVALALVGAAGNTFVFCLLVLSKRLRSKNFMLFAACISFSDIISSVIVFILTLTKMFKFSYTRHLCFGIYVTSVAAFGSSIFFALLISLERLIAVSGQNSRLKNLFRAHRRYIAIAIPPILITCVTLIFIYSYPSTGFYFFCEVSVMWSLNNGRIPVVMEAQVFVTLPVLLIAGLYSLTMIRLRRHMKKVNVTTGASTRKMKSNARQATTWENSIVKHSSGVQLEVPSCSESRKCFIISYNNYIWIRYRIVS